MDVAEGRDLAADCLPRKRLRVYPSFFGFGFYWAWLWLLFFTADCVPAQAHSMLEVNVLRALCLGVEAVVFLAFVVNMLRRDPALLRRGVDNVLICVLGGVATAGIIVFGAVDFEGSLALYAASWVAWGIAGAFLTVLWGRILDSLSAAGICFYLAGSMVLGASVVYVLTYMPTGFICAASVALPLLSVLLAHHAKNVIRSDDFEGKVPPAPVTDPVPVPAPLARILLGVLVYSLALGLVLGMAASGEGGGFDDAHRASLAAPIVVGVALAALSYLKNDTSSLVALYRFAMPAVVVGLLMLSAGDSADGMLAGFAIVAGFQCFDAVVMVVLFQGSRHFEHLSIRSFVMGRLANVFGLAVGWAIGVAAACGFLPSGLGSTSLCLVAVAAIAAFSSFFLLEKDLFPGVSQGKGAVPPAETPLEAMKTVPDMDEVIARIAKEAGLSAQETRVFAFLAKGHSRKTIQEKLFIASATVDTHARHVYRKLNVKSRQELIDLVGEAMAGR